MHPIEKLASKLNLALRRQAKTSSKTWKKQARKLLKESFELLNQAQPDDAELNLLENRLKTHIDKANSSDDVPKLKTQTAKKTSSMPTTTTSAERNKKKEKLESSDTTELGQKDDKTTNLSPMPKKEDHKAAKRPKPQKKPEQTAKTEPIGYFEMVQVEIRQFFTINACLPQRPLAQASANAERHSDVLAKRIEAFIAVLSKAASQEEDSSMMPRNGYREELIKDMPELGLVLHPKRKK